MKKYFFIGTSLLFAFCFSAKAQQQKTVVLNNRQMIAQDIPVNPKDTALMRRILMLFNPAMLNPDRTAKIYTKEIGATSLGTVATIKTTTCIIVKKNAKGKNCL